MNYKYRLENLFWNAADWVYPPACAGCGRNGYRFCSDCLGQVEPLEFDFCLSCNESFVSPIEFCPTCTKRSKLGIICTSWSIYKDPLRSAIHRLKYEGDQGLGIYFAEKMIPILTNRPWIYDIVVPIPLSKKKMQERGYNQAALISHPLANFFKIEHSTNSLIRIKETENQFKLPAEERFKNMQDAFSANPAKLKGRKVLIVDDIITTGATLLQAQEVILTAGATACYGISIAKAGILDI